MAKISATKFGFVLDCLEPDKTRHKALEVYLHPPLVLTCPFDLKTQFDFKPWDIIILPWLWPFLPCILKMMIENPKFDPFHQVLQ